jgi:ABC-2 type transport system permease protein
MNTRSSSTFESTAAAPVAISTLQRFVWSVRRELWECRYLYIAPLAVAPLVVLGFLIRVQHHIPVDLRRAAEMEPMRQQMLINQPYDIAGGLMMLITLIVTLFYCLDTLYGERRDRSILFWKSLPVSDVTTVLAKLSIPLLIVPVVGWASALVTQLLMALISSVVVAMNGMSVAEFWVRLSLPRMSGLLLYHLLTVHAWWWALFYGWALLVSAWARRAPLLWAVLPLVAISLVERIAFNTSHFLDMLNHRLLGGGSQEVILPMQGVFPTHPMVHMTPFRYVTNPGLWIGLAITAVFVAGAIQLRRYREPI